MIFKKVTKISHFAREQGRAERSGAQWELMNAYGELISTYTSNVAKKRLEEEGIKKVDSIAL